MTQPLPAIPLNRAAVDATADITAPANQVATPKQTAEPSSRFVEGLKWLVSFPAMLGMFLIGRVFYEARGFVVDPDVWWHIKVAQDILRTHHFPTVDPYSFTAAGTPWIAYEWLGEVVLASMYRLGGVVSLCVFLIAFGSIILISLYWLAAVRSRNAKAGFISAL